MIRIAAFTIATLMISAINCGYATTGNRVPTSQPSAISSIANNTVAQTAISDPNAFLKSLIAPAVALLVGIINLIWNLINFLATKRVSGKAQRSARKMAALNPYRMDAVKVLKELLAHTAMLVSIPRSANYNGVFKPGQERFIASSRELRHTMTMMSLDPEVDGDNWRSCFDGNYDRFLDCSNTLLNPRTNDADHAVARQRLTEIAGVIQADVLAKFSSAIDKAQS